MNERSLGLIGLLFISNNLCGMLVRVTPEHMPAVQNEKLNTVKALNQLLINAAKVGDASLIRELLKKGARVLGKDQLGYTTFEWAAIRGHIECVNVLLDQRETNALPDAFVSDATDYRDYCDLEFVKSRRTLFISYFQRDVRSLSQLAACIEKIHECLRQTSKNVSRFLPTSDVFPPLQRILTGLKVQFSLSFVLSRSANRPALQKALIAAGAQEVDDISVARFLVLRGTDRTLYRMLWQVEDDYIDAIGDIDALGRLHLDDLMHFATQLDSEELLKALIGAEANVNDSDDFFETPLSRVARTNKPQMAKILLAAGAMLEDKDRNQRSAFAIACAHRSFDVGQVLFESGAQVCSRGTGSARVPHLDFSSSDRELYFKMLLQGSKRRYMPTKKETKRALQNITFFMYFFGTQLRLPFYIIYEIVLCATGEQHDAQGQAVAPEWTKALKRVLEVIYLYQCNGNKLFPLWEQTIRCLVKDPQEQARIISQYLNFMQPFLGNDVKDIVCSSLMRKIAHDSESLPVGQELELYCKQLGEYLHIDGFDAL